MPNWLKANLKSVVECGEVHLPMYFSCLFLDVQIKYVKIVRVEMKSDPSLNLNDEAVSNAILQEVRFYLYNVITTSWQAYFFIKECINLLLLK